MHKYGTPYHKFVPCILPTLFLTSGYPLTFRRHDIRYPISVSEENEDISGHVRPNIRQEQKSTVLYRRKCHDIRTSLTLGCKHHYPATSNIHNFRPSPRTRRPYRSNQCPYRPISRRCITTTNGIRVRQYIPGCNGIRPIKTYRAVRKQHILRHSSGRPNRTMLVPTRRPQASLTQTC